MRDSEAPEHRLSLPKTPGTTIDRTQLEEAVSGLATFIGVLRKYWTIVAATVIVFGSASLVYSKLTAPVFEAIATLEFDPNAVQPLGTKTDGLASLSSYWDNRENYETQYKLLTSDSLLSIVVKDLNLAADPGFLGVQKLPETLPTVEDVAARLRLRIKIEPIKNSRLFLIRVQDTDKARSRRICEALAQTYIRENLQKGVAATSDAVIWLRGQVDDYRQQLEVNENALHDFKARNELPSTSINEASNMQRVELQAYNEAVVRTRTRRQELSARVAELTKVSPASPELVPGSELIGNIFLQGLRTSYLIARKERKELIAEGKGENHPLVKKADERIEEARESLITEVKSIQGAIEKDLAILQRQEGGESSLYEGARKKAVDLNMKEIEYKRLDRSREQNEKLYGMLLERMKQADLARMMNVNNVRMVDPPLEPKGPIRPRPVFNLAIAMIVGLFCGMLFAGLREQLDSTVKTPEDVEVKLNLTFLGLIPEYVQDAPKRRRRGVESPPELMVHTAPLSGMAEAARAVRTNLMFMNPDRPPRTLLISSAAPSEGKTTVACSTAIALAQSGQRVCIIDCDLRRPRLHRVFNRQGDMGVTNVLIGEATIDEVAQPTIVDHLYCIPAGPTPPNAADLLQSGRFREFLDGLLKRFDRVVIDSPPAVAVTDAAIISTQVNGVIFVMRAFKTTKALSRQGLRSLSDVDAPLLGGVLNAVNLNKHEYNRYYHYYYYKREGYLPTTTPEQHAESAPN